MVTRAGFGAKTLGDIAPNSLIFPSYNKFEFPQDLDLYLIGDLCDFANDGLLETMGKPHKSKERWITNIIECIGEEIEIGNISHKRVCSLTKMEIFAPLSRTFFVSSALGLRQQEIKF